MIRRLVEASYAQHGNAPSEEQLQFWLLESRTPDMLIELAARFPGVARSATVLRPLVAEAITVNRKSLRQSLAQEQEAERDADRSYWEPLKRELEQLRRGRR